MEANILAIITFFITIISVLGETPTWSNKYYVKGVLHIPLADIHEPLDVWYDGASKKGLISYYDGTTKTYQFGNIGYGVIYKIVPFSTIINDYIVKCLKVEGNENLQVKPQTVLPSLEGFTYTGKEYINGKSAEIWKMTETEDNVVTNHKMLITYKINPSNNQKIAVPIMYEVLGYDSLFDSHRDHYYLNYSSFIDDGIPQSIFELDPRICRFPTQMNLDEHFYTFNPMAELIRPKISTHVDSEFEKFKSKHKILYQNDSEHIRRKYIFRQNLRYIHSTNRRNLGYSLATNHLADKHVDELRAMRGLRYSNKYTGNETILDKELTENNIPENFDWRKHGIESPVKDQALCGTCWAFAAIGAIEGAYYLHNNGNRIRLSEQALVDCTWKFGSRGCDGGHQVFAFTWIKHHGGVPTEADYGPYLGDAGRCHVNNVPVGVNIKGWVRVTSNNEDALRSAIFKNGPVTINIFTSLRSFAFYSDGIYNDPQCSTTFEDMHHAVLLVGYGSIDGKKYWLIKNSWSIYWGDEGYMRIATENNICGVMNTPVYVTM